MINSAMKGPGAWRAQCLHTFIEFPKRHGAGLKECVHAWNFACRSVYRTLVVLLRISNRPSRWFALCLYSGFGGKGSSEVRTHPRAKDDAAPGTSGCLDDLLPKATPRPTQRPMQWRGSLQAMVARQKDA